MTRAQRVSKAILRHADNEGRRPRTAGGPVVATDGRKGARGKSLEERSLRSVWWAIDDTRWSSWRVLPVIITGIDDACVKLGRAWMWRTEWERGELMG